MANKTFNLVFSGKLVEGARPVEVLARLCRVLELEEPRVRELFKGGEGSVILKNLDGHRAYDLRDKMVEAGAICTVQEVEQPAGPAAAGSARPGDPSRPSPRDVRPAWQPPPPEKKSGLFSLLFKVVIVAALCAGGWWGYQKWFAPPSPAYQAYTQYAEALAREQYQKAAEVSENSARLFAEGRAAMMAPTTMKVYGKQFSMDKPSISSIAGDISWIKWDRKAEEKGEAGTVVLEVEETVCRIPPGVSSALCKWPVTFRHNAEVSQIDGAWKVQSFKEERLTPQ